MKTGHIRLATLSAMLLAGLSTSPLVAAATTTSVSVGVDYASGDYGTPDNTSTTAIPVSLKVENGPWTFRASIPYVRAEGTFSRDQGVGVSTGKRTESGIGDLTTGAYYNVLNQPNGLSIDVGGKVKLATADEKKTLITSGENDYSAQVDFFQSLPNVALFATLGYTIKGEPTGVTYKNPFYTSLGLSVPLPSSHTVGAAWDYRQKVTSSGDPISELSAFYSMKLNPANKIQLYLVHGLSDGSPEIGGGMVFTHAY